MIDRRRVSTTGEVDMFARKVSALLKPNSVSEFAKLMEGEVLPWLRKQKGFLDLIILVVPNGREVATISFWDQPASAEAYSAKGYPEVLEILEGLLDGCPYVKTFKVVSSTLQEVPSVIPPEPENLQETGPAQFSHPSV
ncbi:MAG: hypothetical protein WA474_01410 [Candidatus Sulfotelmatobacter sp.]